MKSNRYALLLLLLPLLIFISGCNAHKKTSQETQEIVERSIDKSLWPSITKLLIHEFNLNLTPEEVDTIFSHLVIDPYGIPEGEIEKGKNKNFIFGVWGGKQLFINDLYGQRGLFIQPLSKNEIVININIDSKSKLLFYSYDLEQETLTPIPFNERIEGAQKRDFFHENVSTTSLELTDVYLNFRNDGIEGNIYPSRESTSPVPDIPKYFSKLFFWNGSKFLPLQQDFTKLFPQAMVTLLVQEYNLSSETAKNLLNGQLTILRNVPEALKLFTSEPIFYNSLFSTDNSYLIMEYISSGKMDPSSTIYTFFLERDSGQPPYLLSIIQPGASNAEETIQLFEIRDSDQLDLIPKDPNIIFKDLTPHLFFQDDLLAHYDSTLLQNTYFYFDEAYGIEEDGGLYLTAKLRFHIEPSSKELQELATIYGNQHKLILLHWNGKKFEVKGEI